MKAKPALAKGHVPFQKVQQPPTQAAPERPRLTRRQAQVAELVARGLCDCEIAATLGLSENTVGAYLNAVFKRYGVHTRTALTCVFFRGREGERGLRTARPLAEPLHTNVCIVRARPTG